MERSRNGWTCKLYSTKALAARQWHPARVIRPRQEVAFSYARPTATAIARSVNTRFTRIALRQAALRDVTVVVDEEGVATLTGEVASAESQRLAAIMVRLEPGVRSVVNELTVAGGGE